MKEKRINSLKSYIAYMDKYKGNCLFRGQANEEWKICPSLFRDSNMLNRESSMIQESEYFDKNNLATSIFKMQHYGISTRMIDLTNSIFSAMFFACDGSEDKNGVIYIFDKNEIVFSSLKNIEELFKCILEDDLNNLIKSREEIFELSQDKFINYDYNFSYSNERAMRQGGTAIVVGLGIKEQKLTRKKELDIESICSEKIVIAFEKKAEIRKELEIMGFCSEFLYDNFNYYNSSNDLELILAEPPQIREIHALKCKKIVANFTISNLGFNIDKISDLVIKTYDKFSIQYGSSARQWLYIYYDKKDREAGNYVCRLIWDEKCSKRLVWNKNYMSKRLVNINEKISSNEVFKKAKKYFNETCILAEALFDQFKVMQIKDFCANIDRLRSNINSIFIKESNCGKCDGLVDSIYEQVNNLTGNFVELLSQIKNSCVKQDFQLIDYCIKNIMNKYVKQKNEISTNLSKYNISAEN